MELMLFLKRSVGKSVKIRRATIIIKKHGKCYENNKQQNNTDIYQKIKCGMFS
jgi:hypothetical protein